MDLLQHIEASPGGIGGIPGTDSSENGHPVQVSDADKFQAICDVLESVWLGLTENMQHALKVEQIPDWVDTLQWAIKVLPVGYEKQRDIIQAELRGYQPKMTK